MSVVRAPADTALGALGRAAEVRAAALRAEHDAGRLSATLAEAPAPREFGAALRQPGLRVIAEIKRASPSRGAIRPGADPALLAASYATGRAAALSVLTEPERFGGDLAALASARSACELPVLMKDFVVDPIQLAVGRSRGADAALLIVAMLEPAALAALYEEGRALGLDLLVEAHTIDEIEAALALGADLVGVNVRDLRTLVVHPGRHAELAAAAVGEGRVAIAESGLQSGADLRARAAMGYGAFLVGSALMDAPDPGAALRGWLEGP